MSKIYYAEEMARFVNETMIEEVRKILFPSDGQIVLLAEDDSKLAMIKGMVLLAKTIEEKVKKEDDE